MHVTRELYDEIREVRNQIERLRIVRESGISNKHVDFLIQHYKKQFTYLRGWIEAVLKHTDSETKLIIEYYYFHGLTEAEIAEFVCNGSRGAESIRNVIDTHLEWISTKKEKSYL